LLKLRKELLAKISAQNLKKFGSNSNIWTLLVQETQLRDRQQVI